MVDDAIDAFGRLDILVQNAFSVISGESRIHGDALSVEEEDWDYGIDVLVKALYLGAKHAVPHMREAGGGSIINLASVHSYLQETGMLVYETGKGRRCWTDASIGSAVRAPTAYAPMPLVPVTSWAKVSPRCGRKIPLVTRSSPINTP